MTEWNWIQSIMVSILAAQSKRRKRTRRKRTRRNADVKKKYRADQKNSSIDSISKNLSKIISKNFSSNDIANKFRPRRCFKTNLQLFLLDVRKYIDRHVTWHEFRSSLQRIDLDTSKKLDAQIQTNNKIKTKHVILYQQISDTWMNKKRRSERKQANTIFKVSNPDTFMIVMKFHFYGVHMLFDVTQEELVSRAHDSSLEFQKRVVALDDTEDTRLRHRKLSCYFTVVRRNSRQTRMYRERQHW